MNRATTIPGSPGNATAVATRTTGLIAGAASRKASAAESGRPCPISRRATGTDAHSQPGSTAPASPATGTASAGRLGSSRPSAAGDTKAAISPDSTTPSTRNGNACTQTATNTVAAMRTVEPSSAWASGRWNSSAAISTALNTCSEVSRGRRPRSVALFGLALFGPVAELSVAELSVAEFAAAVPATGSATVGLSGLVLSAVPVVDATAVMLPG